MPSEIDSLLRNPKAYQLARKVIDAMESHRVWPTALNFELWMHYVAAKDSEVAAKIDSVLQSGAAFTDQVGEQIAAQHRQGHRHVLGTFIAVPGGDDDFLTVARFGLGVLGRCRAHEPAHQRDGGSRSNTGCAKCLHLSLPAGLDTMAEFDKWVSDCTDWLTTQAEIDKWVSHETAMKH